MCFAHSPGFPELVHIIDRYAVPHQMFIFGGLNSLWNGKATCNSLCIDVSDRDAKWMELSAMPRRRIRGSAATIRDDCIVVTGGVNNESGCLSVVDCYSIATCEWSTFTFLPEGRLRHTAVVCNDRVYVMGGYTGGGSSCMVYDETSCKWKTFAPMVSVRYSHTAI